MPYAYGFAISLTMSSPPLGRGPEDARGATAGVLDALLIFLLISEISLIQRCRSLWARFRISSRDQ
jgi:hypothetical protein